MENIKRQVFATDTASPATGQRSQARDSLFLVAKLKAEGDENFREVRIRNLSADGLMAEINRTMVPGQGVMLDIRGIGEVHGTVAWFAEGRIGVALTSSIDPKRARKPVGKGSAEA